MEALSPNRPRRGSIRSRVETLDLFPKSAEVVKENSLFGAFVSVVGIIFIVYLGMFEFQTYYTPHRQDSLSVNVMRNTTERMAVDLDFMVYGYKCEDTMLRYQDAFGRDRRPLGGGFHRKMFAQKVDPQGTIPHFAGGFQRTERRGPSRHSASRLIPNSPSMYYSCQYKVAITWEEGEGSLKILPASNRGWVPAQILKNMTHEINGLAFGPYYPDRECPLCGHKADEDVLQSTYSCSVVPISYTPLNGETINSYQYTCSASYKTNEKKRQLRPEVVIKWQLSPYSINTIEVQRSTSTHFVTRMCAIFGGTFVVVGLIYRAILRVTRELVLLKDKAKKRKELEDSLATILKNR
ncbi:hypothetical protein QOT17_011594 [Balamuthia mandrillaris]